jgi:excinuclease UvrABC ATPase subunit
MQQFAIDAYREAGVGLECLRLAQSPQQRSGGIAQRLRKLGPVEHEGC